MHKKIKEIIDETKDIQKKEKTLLKVDKKQDKLVDKAKKKMKGKC